MREDASWTKSDNHLEKGKPEKLTFEGAEIARGKNWGNHLRKKRAVYSRRRGRGLV